QTWLVSEPVGYDYENNDYTTPPEGGFWFEEGRNIVTLAQNGGDWVSYDYLLLTRLPDSPVPPPVDGGGDRPPLVADDPEEAQDPTPAGASLKYETERYFDIAADSVWTLNAIPGYSGTGYQKLSGGAVDLRINVPQSGWYKVEAAVSTLGDDGSYQYGSASFKINGEQEHYIITPNTAQRWIISEPIGYDYENNAYTTPPEGGFWFEEGRNIVTLAQNGGDWVSYDYILLTRLPDEQQGGREDEDEPDDPAKAQDPTPAGTSLKYEAERYFDVAAESVWTLKSIPGYSGRGYQKLGGGAVAMRINVPQNGWYKVEAAVSTLGDDGGYQYGSASFKVNGAQEHYIVTPDTEQTWIVSEPVGYNYSTNKYTRPPADGFYFKKGANIVTLAQNGGDWVSYDYILLTRLPDKQYVALAGYKEMQEPVIDGESLVYETEDAYDVVADSVWTLKSIPGYSGTGYQKLGGGAVDMRINVPESGRYKVEAAVSTLGDDGGYQYGSASFKVNGGQEHFIITPPHETNWVVSEPIAYDAEADAYTTPPEDGFWFEAGKNVVTLAQSGGDWVSYDYIRLTPLTAEIPDDVPEEIDDAEPAPAEDPGETPADAENASARSVLPAIIISVLGVLAAGTVGIVVVKKHGKISKKQ
ncbi:MAG: hypothetical protein LBL15_07565, partial [Oscillospiraceae bacterium]|nr:hypothetical protein [Oscillospiraceae bacterium]